MELSWESEFPLELTCFPPIPAVQRLHRQPGKRSLSQASQDQEIPEAGFKEGEVRGLSVTLLWADSALTELCRCEGEGRGGAGERCLRLSPFKRAASLSFSSLKATKS